MSSGPMAESPWLKRVWERLGGVFDQDRQRNVTLEEILVELQADPSAIPVADLVYELLRDPDNADTPDMRVDGSGADRTFRWTAAARTAVERINFVTADNAKDVPNGFFSLGVRAVGDGCLIRAHNADDAVLKDFMDSGEIRFSSQFGLLAGVDVDSDTVANLSAEGIRWTIGKAGALAIIEVGSYIEFTIRSDLSGLELFQAQVQGKVI